MVPKTKDVLNFIFKDVRRSVVVLDLVDESE